MASWLESVEYDKVTQTAEWTGVEEFTSQFAAATVKVSKESYDLYELMSGYEYTNRELRRASETGFPLQTVKAQAVMNKAETVLEHIAADGTKDGTNKLSGTLEGFFNQSSVTPYTDPSVATTSYESLNFNTADEQDTFVETVIADAVLMERKAEIDTKETTNIDTLVYPLSMASLFQRGSRNSGGRSIINLMLDRLRHVERIEFWNKAETAGAGGLRRIVGYNSRDEDAAKFVLAQAPTPGRQFVMMNKVAIPVTMVVGGFQTKIPESMIYVDSVAA